MNRPLHRFGVLLAAATLALAACQTSGSSGNTPTPSPSSASPATPVEALIAAAAALKTTSHDFTIDTDSAGSADPAKHLLGIHSTDVDNPGELVATTEKLYFKIDLGAEGNQQLGIDPTKFMEINLSQLATTEFARFNMAENDGLGVHQFLREGLVDATRTGNEFTGHLDFSKLTGALAVKADELTKAGADAKAVPLTATVDDQGRLIALKVDTSSVDSEINKDLSIDLKVTNYGSGTPITVPGASDVVPIPPKFLEFLVAEN